MFSKPYIYINTCIYTHTHLYKKNIIIIYWLTDGEQSPTDCASVGLLYIKSDNLSYQKNRCDSQSTDAQFILTAIFCSQHLKRASPRTC